MTDAKIRLFVDCPLGAGQGVALSEGQANYLFAVMRLPLGAGVLVFNGTDGEWLATVAEGGKRTGRLVCLDPARPQVMPPDLWLLFAPVKKERTQFIVEKAVELGAARLCPVQTRFTNAERLRVDKARAHAIEAAEQCGATFVPPVEEVQPLDRLLSGWPEGRRILWADESLITTRQTLAALTPGPWAVLIGPEGGFSVEERDRLRAHPAVVPVSLGPRILRAETAAIAALTLWQSTLGDWT
ncbi:MAG: 16S rRNA (uracil(1498)-N(3))-methyltransferase [Rhodobacteraceae bacterium PARR1]|nr:MAG: 16S rRNA (uracil(1498)-N(3))-methyltransferase [Rhodobacteraceae bacterium PARR1]